MSTISSIDTSVYSGLIEGMSSASGRVTQNGSNAVKTAEITPETASVDLSNYYSNVMLGDLLQTVADNVTQAANDLDNAMINALENGYTVQDACNIQAAKAAYEANCRVAQSTFEIAV